MEKKTQPYKLGPQKFKTRLSPGSGNIIISISHKQSETKNEMFTSKLF